MSPLGGNGEKPDKSSQNALVGMHSLRLLLHTAALEALYFRMLKFLSHIPSNLPDCFSLLPWLQEFAHALPPSGLPSLTCLYGRTQAIPGGSRSPVNATQPSLAAPSESHLPSSHSLQYLYSSSTMHLIENTGAIQLTLPCAPWEAISWRIHHSSPIAPLSTPS